MILRPQEISNHLEIVRRLGIIAINAALEIDMYSNVNSTHVRGTHMMNGIGGSGDFARNAGIAIFVTKSIAKGGAISNVVPFVSHVDHTDIARPCRLRYNRIALAVKPSTTGPWCWHLTFVGIGQAGRPAFYILSSLLSLYFLSALL